MYFSDPYLPGWDASVLVVVLEILEISPMVLGFGNQFSLFTSILSFTSFVFNGRWFGNCHINKETIRT